MQSDERDPGEDSEKPVVGAGYALFQMARALTTEGEHPDPATRARASARVANWIAVFQRMLTGTLAVGSRTPLEGVPGWATLKVLTGGFATGELLAEGPLEAHERALLERLSLTGGEAADARRALNRYYLTDDGLAELREMLQSGRYEVNVPEEGALPVVAWLAANGHAEQARQLLETIGPWFSRLRFYPVPTDRARPIGSRVFLQDVGETIESLRRIRPNPRILAQKEAVCIWMPLHDRVVALFLETVEGEPPDLERDAAGRWERAENGRFPVRGGWPCRSYPEDWAARADALLEEYDSLRARHDLCGKPERAGEHSAQLRRYLRQCAQDPASLDGRDVGRIRTILACYIARRGTPESPPCRESRERQTRHAALPTHQALAEALLPRLLPYPEKEGLDDPEPVVQPFSEEEARRWDIPVGTAVPPSLRQKVQRCLNDTVDALVRRGLITSGDTLARVLPRMTSQIRAAGIADPTLRRLYAAVYGAFRRRRSLLLLNLEKQVRIEELPWVAAIDRFRSDNLSARELARQALEEVSLLAIASFPHAILPNKLLQELRALVKTAGMDLPLVEEVAADIFMGEFSEKFAMAARLAADVLEGTLYASYYGIDYRPVRELPKRPPARGPRPGKTAPDPLAPLCAARAGVALGGWSPATNGMIIEQQQILTSQNLAVLFDRLSLADALSERLTDLPRECFRWVCRRLQVKADHRHARLIQIKNAAYAWRQMVFFLSLLSPDAVAEFLAWAREHLDEQPWEFRMRFHPALAGLNLAAEGHPPDGEIARRAGAVRFLGWSDTGHWLLADG